MNKLGKGSIEVSSTVENLSEIERFIDQFLQKYSLGDEVYGKIFLAVIEGANNAIFHGNKLDPKKMVKIDFETTQNELIVDIHDQGEGFDYANLPDPTLPENIEKPDGRGVFIISNLSDKVEYNEQGNQMRITFNL